MMPYGYTMGGECLVVVVVVVCAARVNCLQYLHVASLARRGLSEERAEAHR